MFRKISARFLILGALLGHLSWPISGCEGPLTWSGVDRFRFQIHDRELDIHDSKFDNIKIARVFLRKSGLIWSLLHEDNYVKGCFYRRKMLGVYGRFFPPENSLFSIMRRQVPSFVNDGLISSWAGKIYLGFPGVRGDRAFVRTTKGYLVLSAGTAPVAVIDQISVIPPPDVSGTWIEKAIHECLDRYLGIFYDHSPLEPFPE